MSKYFRGRGGLKLDGRSKVNHGKNSDMGEGGIKNSQINSDVFYGWPLSPSLTHSFTIILCSPMFYLLILDLKNSNKYLKDN